MRRLYRLGGAPRLSMTRSDPPPANYVDKADAIRERFLMTLGTTAQPQPEDVIFYKIDHFGDPEVVRGRIVLGVEACMKGLRATANPGQLIVAIGGRTAGRNHPPSQVLRNRLVWVGIVEQVVPGAAPDGRPLVICRGVFFGEKGILDWRLRWPVLGPWVDRIGRMHRNKRSSIPPAVREALLSIGKWALGGRMNPPRRSGSSAGCPPLRRVRVPQRPRGPCPPRKRSS
jgi:hypothetical protein